MQSPNASPGRPEPARLPVPLRKEQHQTHDQVPRLAALRDWWARAWSTDGTLHRMWEDIVDAPLDGPRYMAPWLRTVLAVAGLSVVVLLAQAAAETLLQALHHILTAVPKMQVGADTSSGVFAVVDQPVRTYIAQHSAGLPIEASTVYTLWQLVGITGLALGYLSRNNGVRALWTAWGAATVVMVWTATPHPGRPVAAGLAVIAWTFLSAVAMRGLTLRRRIAVLPARPANIVVQPEIHIPAPAAPADQHTGCPFRN
ncbi:hypothetical protein [Streptomyces tsukubensis]|uniref:hypothetical protein n=1 Tax=Streptomyces tsukubensis TaxID=83656 RepID=UPI00344D149B